ncbi:MAG: 4Fe-4S binding protein [Thermoplasmata archaeon]|nr:4Fe-4S binding protein [Thermoplasmata archaeon]
MIVIKNKITTSRWVVQLLWFVFFAHGILFGIPAFGSSATLRNIFIPNFTTRFLINSPGYCYLYEMQNAIQGGNKLYYLNLIIPFLIVAIFIIILGRVWCGWLCPFGFFQDLMSKTRKTAKRSYKELPYSAVVILDRFKYALLFLIVLILVGISIPAFGLYYFRSDLALPYCQVCPVRPLYIFYQQLFGFESWSTSIPIYGIIVLTVVVVTGFVVRRSWCRVCPMGALLALFSRRALITLRKDSDKCIKCRVCLRACPMDIREVYEEMEKDNISSPECIHCYRCVELCPEEGCLSVAVANKDIVKSKPMAKK